MHSGLKLDNIDLTEIKEIIERSLKEDIGKCDITTSLLYDNDHIVNGQFIVKKAGVIAGLAVAKMVFDCLDNNIRFTNLFQDGSRVEQGAIIADIRVSAYKLLAGERVALNFLQRMSGIATLTNKFVEKVAGTQTVILDTRKTVPGLRILDKWAVRLGGGKNHRFGLHDMVLIKENHIKLAGSIVSAVNSIKKGLKENNQNMEIEIEVKNHAELKDALELGANRILLDNMTFKEIRKAVSITKNTIPLEVSGNVTLENVSSIAATGINYVSVGMLTHSVKALDISFLITMEPRSL